MDFVKAFRVRQMFKEMRAAVMAKQRAEAAAKAAAAQFSNVMLRRRSPRSAILP